MMTVMAIINIILMMTVTFVKKKKSATINKNLGRPLFQATNSYSAKK